MSLPVAYLPEALDDVEAAYLSYEGQCADLGNRFLAALRSRIDVIADNPNLYAVLHRDVRAAPLRRFPYVVYYRVESSRA